jgi:hypothetical protein
VYRDLEKYVRRYTTLSSAIYTLREQKLVLLNPSKWDDTNDVYFMELYRAHKGAEAVLALCCTKAAETYHHWRVFTQGIEGVCIEFYQEKLKASLRPSIIGRSVDYLLVSELEALSPDLDADRLPFIKREGFGDEREWRIITTSSEVAKQTEDVPIQFDMIRRIILNPWMPPSLAESVRQTIRDIPHCEKLKVESSRLTNSASWKAAGKKLVS